MKFNAFIITVVGLVFIGISIGYVLGYYLGDFLYEDYWSYLCLPFMGVGCFMVIYGSLFNK